MKKIKLLITKERILICLLLFSIIISKRLDVILTFLSIILIIASLYFIIFIYFKFKILNEQINKANKVKIKYNKKIKQIKEKELELDILFDSNFNDTYSPEEHLALGLFKINNFNISLGELKKKYRNLMKEFHPDEKGENSMAKIINSSYDLLKKKA